MPNWPKLHVTVTAEWNACRLNELDLTAVIGSGTFVMRHSSVIALLSDVLLSNCVCVMYMHVSSAAVTDTIKHGTFQSARLQCFQLFLLQY